MFMASDHPRVLDTNAASNLTMSAAPLRIEQYCLFVEASSPCDREVVTVLKSLGAIDADICWQEDERAAFSGTMICRGKVVYVARAAVMDVRTIVRRAEALLPADIQLAAAS